MKSVLQNLLLALYRAYARSGLARTRLGRALFLRAYLLYKTFFERSRRHLEHYVRPDTLVIDVGANVGFFTLAFARWVSGENGRVLAIEPEAENLRALRAAVAASHHADRVDIIAAVAVERAGERRLALNPVHPADHRLASEGVAVAGVTLSDLVKERGDRPVSLIKVDVQGAEMLVLQGAIDVLMRDRPALFLEIDDSALAATGTSSSALIAFLESLGYRPHVLDADGAARKVSLDEAAKLRAALGYADFLFLADAPSAQHAAR